MELTPEHKKEVEQKIVDVILDALDNKTITVEEEQEASVFILEKMPGIKTTEALVAFLRELSAKWRMFSPILVIESGELKEHQEDKATATVEDLAKNGDVESAIKAAKAAMGGNA